MNIIPPSQKRDPNIEQNPSESMQENIYPVEHEFNITDGGEFLDDALRMKDQPLGEINVKDEE